MLAIHACATGRRCPASEDRQESDMASRYGAKAQSKVKEAMHERKTGALRSGGSGKRVTSRKQAIAIGLSEARRAGGKVPSARGKSKAKSKAKSKGKSAGRSSRSGSRAKSTRRTTRARKQ